MRCPATSPISRCNRWARRPARSRARPGRREQMQMNSIHKVALYGAPCSLANALLAETLSRQLNATAIVDELNAIAASPGLSTRNGTPFEADSVGRSVAGMDAVIAVLSSPHLADGNEAAGFSRIYDSTIALLDGLAVAGVERLLLIADHAWLQDDRALPAERVEHLQHSLFKSPIAWTLVDTPRQIGPWLTLEDCLHPAHSVQRDTVIALQPFASSVMDECLQGTNVHQRLHIETSAERRLRAEEAL
ncbi:NADH-flavin reductase [Pseudomonas dryadis]|uniref:NADH-flavin reductase n=2 Tax=Pseudomonadales TaxID=72274 RepID=A0ABY1Z1C5_9GAMM|nr:NADH-flavin reductase [Pseudomonas dryadis]TBV19410.1 NADH-flavin reductase [Pseudomonas sp. FRB 230]